MDYQWHYDKLVETRRNRIIEDSVYYERHHIVMKSMGGTDDLSNIVRLTAREHFLAHWLLWRIHRNKQTAFAFYAMCNFKKEIFSSRGYEESRKIHAQFSSETLTGIKRSDETKLKVSNSRKAYWKTISKEDRCTVMNHAKTFITKEARINGAIKTNLSYTSERRSNNARKIQTSMNDEAKMNKQGKCSIAKASYWSKMTTEEKASRMIKLNEAKKLKNTKK